MVSTEYISIHTKGNRDIIDITSKIDEILKKGHFTNGIVTVFSPGSTGCITTIEYEPGLVKDMNEYLAKNIPYDNAYHHHNTWHDDNGSSHLQAALIGPSLTVPVVEGKMTLGTWQQIVFIDCDTHGRDRTVVVQCIS
jgi:secondary thiamine-phosphate synthase enzyme